MSPQVQGLEPAHAHLARLLQILAPGASDAVAVIEAYFDESDSQDDSDVLAVSGFVFEKEKCLALDKEWAGILAKYGKNAETPLPYFRMSACAHGNYPLEHLCGEQRDAAARECLAAIRSHMTQGLSASISKAEFKEWLGRNELESAAYVWCCWMSLVGVRVWADSVGFDGKIAYIFESGHEHQTTANAIMNYIFKRDNFRANYRYGSHSFVQKECNRPVQTADILAWHHVQDFKKFRDGKPRRKDFAALMAGMDDKFRVIHARKEQFTGDLPVIAAATDSRGETAGGVARSPAKHRALTTFSDRLNRFLPLVSLDVSHEESWPGSVHRAHSPALSHNTQGACVS